MEVWPSGLWLQFTKLPYSNVPRVRIPPLPPNPYLLMNPGQIRDLKK